MKTPRTIALATALFVFVSAGTVSGLGSGAEDGPDALELRSEAEKLIRETAAIAPTLGSAVNRVGIYVRLADLAYDLDQDLTVQMVAAAQEEVKRYLSQIDVEAAGQAAGSNLSGRRSRNSGLRTRTGLALEMRRTVIHLLAKYVPSQASAFLIETSDMLTNPDLRSRAERDNRRLEAQIAKQTAANDIGKAVEMGKERLKEGVSSQVVTLAGSIYSRNRDKGSEFAGEIVSSIGSSPVEPARTWVLTRLFQMALRSEGQTPPMLGSRELRTLATAIEAALLDPQSKYTTLNSDVLEGLDRYNPGAISRIRGAFDQRLAQRSGSGAGNGNFQRMTESSIQDRQDARENARKYREDLGKLFSLVSDPGAGPDEREEAIRLAKESILSVDDDRFRYTNLAGLAVRAYRAGEEDEALSLMKEAESYLKASPRDRGDFAASVAIAGAYAVVDPDRSFAILEEMAYRLNGIIDGYVRFAEYSGNGRTVEGGELVMNRYAKQFTGYFELQTETVKALVVADAGRLASLTDRFDRSEVRAEVKLTLISSLLKAVE